MANPTLQLVHGLLYGAGIHIGTPRGMGRVVAATMGSHADVVPFAGAQIHDHAMTVARVPARKYYRQPDLLVDVQLAVCRWYDFDTPTITGEAYNYEVEALGAKMIYSDNAMPTVDVSDPLIKTPADLDKIGPLDPSKGRIPAAVEIARQVTRKAPSPIPAGIFCSHWSLLCQAMGYPKAVRALKRDKPYAQALFDWAENQAIYPFLQAYARAGVKGANGADAWAAFPNLTLDLTEEWVMPMARRLHDRAKKELGFNAAAGSAAGDYCEEDPDKFDKEMMFQCWDNVRKTFPLDTATALMGRTQEWNMHWLQEYAVLRGKGGRKIPITAALNGRFMRDSTPYQIVSKLREWIDVMGRDGRLMIGIGNVPADTPPVNVHTAVKACRTLGKYPIAADLSKIKIEPVQCQPFDEWLKGQPEADVIFQAREK